jgi:hypothetical protein
LFFTENGNAMPRHAIIAGMEPQTSITVNGALTVGDLQRTSYFGILRRFRVVALLLVVALVIIGLLAVASFSGGGDSGVPGSSILLNAIPFLVLCALWIVLVLAIPYRTAKKRFSTEVAWREPVTYSFSAEGIQAARPSASSSIKWNLVTEAIETRTLFLLYLGRVSIVVVPKRFFNGQAEMDAFKELVRAQATKAISGGGIVGRYC